MNTQMLEDAYNFRIIRKIKVIVKKVNVKNMHKYVIYASLSFSTVKRNSLLKNLNLLKMYSPSSCSKGLFLLLTTKEDVLKNAVAVLL